MIDAFFVVFVRKDNSELSNRFDDPVIVLLSVLVIESIDLLLTLEFSDVFVNLNDQVLLLQLFILNAFQPLFFLHLFVLLVADLDSVLVLLSTYDLLQNIIFFLIVCWFHV